MAELVRTGVTKTRIIILTGAPQSPAIADALEYGAVGLVLKQQPPEALIKAINKVFAGELWLDRTATARLVADLARTTPDEEADRGDKTTHLTKREREVVTLVGAGLRNSQIAARLSISEVTVRNHLTSTFRKLELENRFQLVIYAFQHGLATLPDRGARLEYQAKIS
jgi:DNA-binding NarL/FixJ family response regulator